MSGGYVGRLAPSPTGLLHLGHARTFWTAFARAQAAGGRLWLRDDDLDTQRSKAEYTAAMMEDLHWLGIAWEGAVRQSERLPLYRAAAEHLVAAGIAYACTCSRRDLQRAIAAPHEDDDEPVYDGRCRPAGQDGGVTARVPGPGPGAPGLVAGVNYRLRVPDAEAVEFHDALAGPQSFTAGVDFGDFLIWRKDGLPSYQLACAADDAAMGVTEVVRGRDMLKSTARQIVVQRSLELATPLYAHCELMRDEEGTRLAKRHDALSLRALRKSGMSAEDVRAMFP